MKIIAYVYSDPVLESPPDSAIWGLEIDQVYQDLGQRQQLESLLRDCKNDPPNYLLVRHLEELGNSVEEINNILQELKKLKVEIIATEQSYSSQQENYQNNPKLWQEIINKQRRKRLQKGHALKRIKALPPPGKAPYGYRRGKDRYIIDRSTAPVVKDFFERFLLFGSLRGAVRYLEKRYGKKISVSTGKKWLTNPVYRGDLAYHNQTVIPDTHVPIISREEAAQIERLLRRNKTLPSRTASAPRSLAGLVRCEQCDSPMTITRVTRKNKSNNQQEYLYIRPLNCPQAKSCKAIPYQDILTAAIMRICQDLPSTVAQLNLPNLNVIKERVNYQIKQKQEIIMQLDELIKQGILDQETANLRSYTLKTEIAELQNKLCQLPPGDLKIITKAVSLPQFWLDLSESERRFYFREFINKILILRPSEKEWQLKLVFIF